MASNKKYISLSRLSTFLDNLKNTFALLSHTHKLNDITDYTVDTSLSSTSVNPVQNKVIDAEFEAIAKAMQALELAIDTKLANYYTKAEIDSMVLITPDDIDAICNTNNEG